jgi:hypothetical protein
MFKLRGYLAVAAVAAAMMTCQGASAAVTSCPGTLNPFDVEFKVTTAVAATCVGTGNGLLDEGTAPGAVQTFNGVQYTLLDNDRDPGLFDAETDPPLTLVGGNFNGLTTNQFSINAPGFTTFVLLLQGAVGGLTPDWAAFLLPAGILNGTYTAATFLGIPQDVTDVRLYGIAVPGPIAGAGLPALLALGGFVWARRRKAAVAA